MTSRLFAELVTKRFPALGCVLFLFGLSTLSFVSAGVQNETRLRERLFPVTYNRYARPVTENNDNVTILIDISLNHVVDLNEKLQVLHTETWVRLEWEDPQLTWDPQEFGDISVIYVSAASVWTPDIVIYNEVGLEPGRSPLEFLISVRSDGRIQWLYMRTVETSCKIDAAQYPFDVQTCEFIFGSWSIPGNLLDVKSKNDTGDIGFYVDNGEWSLSNITAERRVRYYMCCSEPFPDVRFILYLQRRSLYYVYNLILPCILITLIHLTSFLLPAESGEKISLNVAILLGMTVFLLLVAEIMPPQSENIPLIGQFFGICIILVSSSTVSSVFILHLHFRGSRGFPVPPRLRSVVIGRLGRYLFYGNLIEKKEKKIEPVAADKDERVELEAIKTVSEDVSCNGKVPSSETETVAHARSGMGCHDNYNLNRKAKPPMEHMGLPNRHIEEKNEEEKLIIRDWILVSLILDRLFFICFLVIDTVFVGFVMYCIVTHQSQFS